MITAPEVSSSPPSLTADGKLRRVGVEIEFMGLSARSAARALARDLGGFIEADDPHAFRIRNSRLGDLRVETDLRYVHPQRYPDLAIHLGDRAAAWLGTLVSPFVPRELVTAPIPIPRLGEVDEAIASLRSAGASGRGAVALDSLSLHFNIDPPSLDAGTITAFLKAFLSAEERLREETVGASLRLALVLPPAYPRDYRERVLAPDYWPDLETLTADYLRSNPTRKRALDLLPLLAHLNEKQVHGALPHEKIGPRPVFHFRLPQAHVGDRDWSILQDWERWISVESLALKQRALQP
jgi:hypothetical protein